MVLIPAVSGGPFCIDSREATSGDYQSFLNASPDPTKQDPICSTNYSFGITTSGEHSNCDVPGYDPDNHPDNPMRCATWCDAKAYCQWAGKRLCGGKAGTQLSDDDYATTKSEWFTACSDNGAHSYPYGDQYSASTCLGVDNPAEENAPGPMAATAAPGCHGDRSPFDQVYAMSGSEFEWEDAAASVNGAIVYHIRGGDRDQPNPSGALRCDSNAITSGGAGFRCCADAVLP